MRYFRGLTVLLLALGLLAGCAGINAQKKDYTSFRTEDPRSILVVPVVNNSTNVDAPDYFLSTVSTPIAERGYYIFPINLVKRVMEEDGLSDANLVHSADPGRLGALYGADAILYIAIEHWETTYIVLAATTTVSFTYVLKSARSGEELWRESETINYTPESNVSGGGLAGTLVAMAVTAAIQKAAPNYMPLAKQANGQAVRRAGKGLPAGPYHEEYGKDIAQF